MNDNNEESCDDKSLDKSCNKKSVDDRWAEESWTLDVTDWRTTVSPSPMSPSVVLPVSPKLKKHSR